MPSENVAAGRRAKTLEMPAWLGAVVAGIVIFGIKAVILIRHSLADGPLSAFLTDDDVGYLFDALHHTAVLRSDGILALIKGLIDGPPHSPTLTLIGAVSFALSGAASFAPYLANGLLLGAVLGLLVHRLSAPLAPSVGILVCVALLPLTDWAIMTFRPDIMAGIVTACTCAILLVSDINRMTNKKTALLGVAGAICLLYKPTAVLPAGALLATALLLAIVKARRGTKNDASKQQMFAAVLIGAGALTCLPYFVPAAPVLLNYINFAMLENTDITGVSGGWFEQVSFYPAWAGELFGHQMWPSALALVLAALILCRRERLNMICLIVIALVAYIVPTIPIVKTSMFGAYFYGSLLICFIAALAALAIGFPRLASVVIVALIAVQLVEGRDDQPAVDHAFLAVYRTISLRAYEGLNGQAPHGAVRIYIGFPWPLGQGVLELKSMQDQQPYQLLHSPRRYFEDRLQSYIDQLTQSDIALIPSPELVSHFSQRLPAERFLDATLQYARANLQMIDEIKTDWGPAYLFKNSAPPGT